MAVSYTHLDVYKRQGSMCITALEDLSPARIDLLYRHIGLIAQQQAVFHHLAEEAGDDVKSSCPLRAGLHTCYNGANKVKQAGDIKQITKMASQVGL